MDRATPLDTLHGAWPDAHVIGISPASNANAAAHFERVFGRIASVILVRPDGYAAFKSRVDGAAQRLREYAQKWLRFDG